jgi:hypothetical protein
LSPAIVLILEYPEGYSCEGGEHLAGEVELRAMELGLTPMGSLISPSDDANTMVDRLHKGVLEA